MARRKKSVPEAKQGVIGDNVLRFIQGWPPGVIEVRILTIHCTACGFIHTTEAGLPHVCKTPDVAGFFKELDTLEPHDQEAVLFEAAEMARSKR